MATVVRVERRLAHQPVHAGLGLEPAVGEVTLDPQRGRLDPGHFAAAGFHQLGLPAARLAPAQVHAQQHLGPILGLGAAGTGLDVDEGIGSVHLAGEHALEFQLLDVLLVALHVGHHRQGGVLVLLALGQFQQFGRTAQAIQHHGDAADGLVEHGALAAQGLGALRVVPDVGQLQLAIDFFQTLLLGVVVKDTPVARPPGR